MWQPTHTIGNVSEWEREMNEWEPEKSMMRRKRTDRFRIIIIIIEWDIYPSLSLSYSYSYHIFLAKTASHQQQKKNRRKKNWIQFSSVHLCHSDRLDLWMFVENFSIFTTTTTTKIILKNSFISFKHRRGFISVNNFFCRRCCSIQSVRGSLTFGFHISGFHNSFIHSYSLIIYIHRQATTDIHSTTLLLVWWKKKIIFNDPISIPNNYVCVCVCLWFINDWIDKRVIYFLFNLFLFDLLIHLWIIEIYIILKYKICVHTHLVCVCACVWLYHQLVFIWIQITRVFCNVFFYFF